MSLCHIWYVASFEVRPKLIMWVRTWVQCVQIKISKYHEISKFDLVPIIGEIDSHLFLFIIYFCSAIIIILVFKSGLRSLIQGKEGIEPLDYLGTTILNTTYIYDIFYLCYRTISSCMVARTSGPKFTSSMNDFCHQIYRHIYITGFTKWVSIFPKKKYLETSSKNERI